MGDFSDQKNRPVELYLSSNSPGADQETNWLPAPAGNFSLIMRHHWPDKSIGNGTWQPPQVEMVK
jgi:hypothetical protein